MSTTANRSDLVRTIAGREISVKLHDKGFIASTVVFLVVIVVATVLPALLQGGTPSYTVGVTQGAQSEAEIAQQLGGLNDDERPADVPAADITLVDVASVDEGFADEDVDAVLTVDGQDAVLSGRASMPGELLTLVTIAHAQTVIGAVATEAGLDADQLATLTAPPAPQVVLADPPPDFAVPPQLVIIVFGFLFYFSVLTFGMSIAQSVVEEKQSRVVELLVAAVPIRWLLSGKVLGNAVLAISQVAIIIGAGLIGASVTGASDVIGQVAGVSGWFLAFFVVGFLMLACLWAVAGSLASRIEDLQSTTLYMQIVVMVPFFAAVLIQDDTPLQRVLSYFPLTAPLLMPARMIQGTAAGWEPWVAMALVLLTAAILIVVGARLYAGSVLNTSQRSHVRSAWVQGAGA
ncbi:ABC transporter permease [Demequina oxidasica]|uniref:ABC transporter permease n=1 Tax=Demequina oxidasica TaxID=676199 RepID=UPI00078484E0|nr:ABC transporter permease [Demequina oxidasica]